MTFHDLDLRLLHLLNRKVQRGEISQRRLARLSGFTQPHIHKILKGAIRIHAELADALLSCLGLSVEHLLEGESARDEIHTRIPLWRDAIGPRQVFPDRLDESTYLLFPQPLVSHLVCPVLLQLDDDEWSMSPLIDPGDVVLMDQAVPHRLHPVFEQISVLSFDGRGAVCRCQVVGGMLVLASEKSRYPDPLPDAIPLGNLQILDVVRGRIVWSCRELGVVAW